jgi:hypothetical protein
MLYTDPVRRDPPSSKLEYAHVYVKSDLDEGYEVQGFHWGGLTSGDWKTVFWILLAPFALANVAGWTTKRNNRWAVALVRVAALALTALLVSQAVTALVLIPFLWFQEQFDSASGGLSKLAAIVLFAITIALFLLLVRTSTQSHFKTLTPQDQFRLLLTPVTDAMLPPAEGGTDKTTPTSAQWDDPAGTVVTDPTIWGTHAILHRLRRLHLAIGLTVVAMGASLWADNLALLWASIVIFALVVISTFATSFWPRNRGLLWITAVSSLTSFGLAVASLTAIGFSNTAAASIADLHTLTFGITVVLGVSAMACVFKAGWLTVGALVIASQFGAVLGVALGLIAEQLAGVDPQLVPNGAGFVAVAMLFLIGVMAIVALILSAIPHPRSGVEGLTTLLRRIVLRGPWLFYSAAAFGIGFGLLVIFKSARESARSVDITELSGIVSTTFGKALFTGFTPRALDPAELGGGTQDAAVVVAGLIVLLAWWRVSAAIGWLRGFLVPAGAAVLVFITAKGFETSFLGLHFTLTRRLEEIAVFVAVLIPGLFMLKSIISGVREGETRRRQVGILWDVGSFWPRWFHPLAPPGYGPIAVDGLRNELKTRHRQVLAAHSQGTLIAAVTVSQMDEADLPDSLLTYGSQLGVLFPAMFPAAGIDQLVGEVSRRFENRWINLWRDDDPIGGHFIEVLDSSNWQVCTGNGHSNHEVTPEYGIARSRVLTGTPTWPTDQPKPACWGGS